MVKIMIEVEIPNYEVKYCDDVLNGKSCRFLQSFNYSFRHYCIISEKEITKTKDNGDKICRPYGCRCLAKVDEY